MEDLARCTLRELLTLARERLGVAAAALKTREELLAALSGGESPFRPGAERVATAPPREQVVTRDFFRRGS